MSKAKSYACKRLSEQIKFFGAKPKRFVSIYAKKPRIRLKVKDDIRINCPPIGIGPLDLQKLAALGGIRSSLASQQAAAAQGIGTSQLAAMQQYNSASQAFMQQQSMRANIGLSNIGQCGGLGLGIW
jgi:hypothetical protein